jgi:hypothetical protein
MRTWLLTTDDVQGEKTGKINIPTILKYKVITSNLFYKFVLFYQSIRMR